MAESDDNPLKTPYPIRSGAIPTPDGVFPVDLQAGGRRRRRRPFIDLDAVDMKAKAADQAVELELAWGIIANAHGGDWSKASPEWQEAATAWRDRYFAGGKVIAPPAPPEIPTANLQLEPSPKLIAVSDITPSPALEAIEALQECHQFLARLAAMPESDVKAILGPLWDGDEDTFEAAVGLKWAEIKRDVAEASPKASQANRPLDPEEEEESRDDPFTPEPQTSVAGLVIVDQPPAPQPPVVEEKLEPEKVAVVSDPSVGPLIGASATPTDAAAVVAAVASVSGPAVDPTANVVPPAPFIPDPPTDKPKSGRKAKATTDQQ